MEFSTVGQGLEEDGQHETNKVSENRNGYMDSNEVTINHSSNPLHVTLEQRNHGHQQLYQDHSHRHLIPPYLTMQAYQQISGNSNFISKDTRAYDVVELDQALFLYLSGNDSAPTDMQEQRDVCEMRPPTLNIFPSQPMHVEPPPTKASSRADIDAQRSSGSKRLPDSIIKPVKSIKREGYRKARTASISEQDAPKTPDPKTLRRLAQNREAARKSRLRKKAYVQQLESSRIKLAQLEQELQRARTQGLFVGLSGNLEEQSIPIGINNLSSDVALFDMEYTKWVEDHHRLMCELTTAMQEELPDNELRFFVENSLAHYDELINLKSLIAKYDVFYLISGVWKTPIERCFMWIGGFRPSEIVKIMASQMEELSEQQILGICGLQQSTQQAEEALSQGLETLNHSLLDTIASESLSCAPDMATFMAHMAGAVNKLSRLEGFVRQADNLRLQTIHRLNELLTIHQAASCLLAIAEYFHRLRVLSSLWLARPRQE